MPYVLINGSGFVYTIMLNPIDESSVYLPDSDDSVQFFYLQQDLINGSGAAYFDNMTETVTYLGSTLPLYGGAYEVNLSLLSIGIGGLDPTITIYDINGNAVSLALLDAEYLIDNLQSYINDVYINMYSLQNQILNAPDLTTLEAIDITSGWPTL